MATKGQEAAEASGGPKIGELEAQRGLHKELHPTICRVAVKLFSRAEHCEAETKVKDLLMGDDRKDGPDRVIIFDG